MQCIALKIAIRIRTDITIHLFVDDENGCEVVHIHFLYRLR